MPSTAPKSTRQPTDQTRLHALEERIRTQYKHLPGSEVALADLILNHPARLATHSATELANDAGVSKAAVTRLIKRLGYPNYAAVRKEALMARQWGSPVYFDTHTTKRTGLQQRYAEHAAADQQILAKTLLALHEQDFEACVQALALARRVVVFGFRNSAWLAMYARAHLGLLRASVELAPLPTETLAEALVGLGPQDVVLAIGLRRRVPGFATALQAANAAQAKTILLTDPTGVADVPFAHWILTCHCQGSSMFDSYVGAVSLLNFMAAQLAQVLGESGLDRLKGVEQWHGRLDDLS